MIFKFFLLFSFFRLILSLCSVLTSAFLFVFFESLLFLWLRFSLLNKYLNFIDILHIGNHKIFIKFTVANLKYEQ